MAGLLIDEKIVAIERAFEDAEIPHAFGGANALAYYAPPRATADIDVNVFVSTGRAGRVLQVLAGLGAATGAEDLMERIERDGQARVFWDRTPVDLFFSYDDLHDSSLERRRVFDFGGVPIHVLSAEDLIVYKVLFDRARDWPDIAEMIFAANSSFDFDYIRSWIGRILEPDDLRFARLEKLIASGGGELDE